MNSHGNKMMIKILNFPIDSSKPKVSNFIKHFNPILKNEITPL